MKHSLIYFSLFGLAALFLLVRTTDWYKSTIDPREFWTDQVARRTELLSKYDAEARKCSDDVELLNRPTSRDLWIQQKALEGLSVAQALTDYVTYVQAATMSCEISRDLAAGARQDLSDAKAELQLAH